MRLFSYVVRWDHGFAPNPFFGLCTVATCKPDIRMRACIGDFVLGTGSASRNLDGKVVFLMRVDRIISFDDYWNDPRYARKVPVMNGSLQQRFGDNIYHREHGKWVQADSRHSQEGAKTNVQNLKRDTGRTELVLVGDEFSYWGGDGPRIPSRLNQFVHKTPAYRSFFTEAEIDRFLSWMGAHPERGLLAEPYEWRFEKHWR